MNSIKKYLPWTIRIIIFVLFIVSGIAKMFPLWAFEKQIVDLGLGSWCFASYFARFIIAFEIAIAFAILQPHYLKKIVIPATIALLAAFCIHLSIEMVKHGAMNGNCGCFGQLLPMTPLEAFIKNIITIGLLIYLYRQVKDREKGRNRFVYLVLIYLASALLMFAAFPFCPCNIIAPTEETPILKDTSTVNSLILPETTANDTVKNPVETVEKKDTTPLKQVEKSPKKVKSLYGQYTDFGNEKVNLDDGKKVVCFFAPGCDHCQHAAKELCILSKRPDFPKVYIFFMNEEADKIPEFFKVATCTFPYKVMEIPVFWKLIGDDAGTPGVRYLWNGNVMKFYEGTGDNKFDPVGMAMACKAKYK